MHQRLRMAAPFLRGPIQKNAEVPIELQFFAYLCALCVFAVKLFFALLPNRLRFG